MSGALITGMALNTPLGDSVPGVLTALLAGQTGIGPWRAFPTPPLGSHVGGDLSAYDIPAKLAAISGDLPVAVAQRLGRMMRRVPWSARLTLLAAADAACQARYWSSEPVAEDVAVICAGHNLAPRYGMENWRKFQTEPDYVDPLLAVHMLDTNHAACVSELLGTRGPIATVGAACASGNLALRAALDELAEGAGAVVVVAPVYEYGPTTFQALGFMRATTEAGPGDASRASRPFDRDRDGFVPSHGAAALVLMSAEEAKKRGLEPLGAFRGFAGGGPRRGRSGVRARRLDPGGRPGGGRGAGAGAGIPQRDRAGQRPQVHARPHGLVLGAGRGDPGGRSDAAR